MNTATADDYTTVGDLRTAVRSFVERRDWRRYHTPKNLAMSIAIEAAEIMEHFQWLTVDESAATLDDPAVHQAVADELADVIIYSQKRVYPAAIQVATAVLAKLARNESRFPVERVHGQLG